GDRPGNRPPVGVLADAVRPHEPVGERFALLPRLPRAPVRPVPALVAAEPAQRGPLPPALALLANITRITVTGVLHKTVGRAPADYVFHDLAGWLMMPLALGLLWAELSLLAWVVVDAAPRELLPFHLGRL